MNHRVLDTVTRQEVEAQPLIAWMKRMVRAMIPDDVWEREYGNGAGEWVIKEVGSTGNADPLAQSGTVGYKSEYKTGNLTAWYGAYVRVTMRPTRWLVSAGWGKVGWVTEEIELAEVTPHAYTYLPPVQSASAVLTPLDVSSRLCRQVLTYDVSSTDLNGQEQERIRHWAFEDYINDNRLRAYLTPDEIKERYIPTIVELQIANHPHIGHQFDIDATLEQKGVEGQEPAVMRVLMVEQSGNEYWYIIRHGATVHAVEELLNYEQRG